MSEYYPAQICLNGHVISCSDNSVEKFCSSCGAKTITDCPSCSTPIRGDYKDEFIVYARMYHAPSYCFSCGKPFPWTKAKVEAMQELIDFDEVLSDTEKSYMNDNLKDLTVDTPKTKVVATKFNVFLRKAGSVTASAIRDILVDIASETSKKIIFQ